MCTNACSGMGRQCWRSARARVRTGCGARHGNAWPAARYLSRNPGATLASIALGCSAGRRLVVHSGPVTEREVGSREDTQRESQRPQCVTTCSFVVLTYLTMQAQTAPGFACQFGMQTKLQAHQGERSCSDRSHIVRDAPVDSPGHCPPLVRAPRQLRQSSLRRPL